MPVARKKAKRRAADPLSEPTFAESHADFCRFMEVKASLDLGNKYPEEFIAYYDGRVVDHDCDGDALRERIDSQANVHPARFLIYYVQIQIWAE